MTPADETAAERHARVIREAQVPRLKIQWLWEPRDVWIGLYWTQDVVYEPEMLKGKITTRDGGRVSQYWSQRPVIVLRLYICLLPLVPLRISIRRDPKQKTPWRDEEE